MPLIWLALLAGSAHRVSDEPLLPEVLAHPRNGQGAGRLHDATGVVEAKLDGLFGHIYGGGGGESASSALRTSLFFSFLE